MQKSSFTFVVKNQGFLNLWLNQILFQLSVNALNFTLITWIFKLTNSNTAIAALIFAIYLPAVLFGLFAGVLVDITDRKKIILVINILMAISFFSLIFFKNSYPAILIIAFFMNTLSQFYSPAEASAIPLIVRKEELLQANSLFTTTFFGSFLAGFGVAGPLINFFGIDTIFLTGGFLLTSAFMLAFFFPSITNKADQEGRQLLNAIRKRDFSKVEGFMKSQVLKTLGIIKGKWLMLFSIVLMSGVQMVIGVLAVLMPAFLERIVHLKSTDASHVLIIPLGIGMVLGGLLIGKLGYMAPKRVIAGTGVFLGGILFLLVSLFPEISKTLTLLSFGAFLLGGAIVSIIIPSQTVLQENAPEQSRGKIFSVLAVMMQGLSLIPVFLAGILADFFGVVPIFISLGLTLVIIGAFVLKPNLYFSKSQMPKKFREFMGEGHWGD